MKPKKQTSTLEGVKKYSIIPKNIIFHSSKNNFTIQRAEITNPEILSKVEKETFKEDERWTDGKDRYTATITGFFDEELNYGDKLNIYAETVKHNKYGVQLQVFMVGVDYKDEKNLRNLLNKFVNDNILKQLFDNYSAEELVQHIHQKTLDTDLIKGMGEKTLESLNAKITESEFMNQIIMQLGEFNLTDKAMVDIVKHFGANTRNIIENHPYNLTYIKGIGFKKADSIARKVGFDMESPVRISHAIRYVIEENEKQSNVYIEKDDLVKELVSLLMIDKSIILENIKPENLKHTTVIDDKYADTYLYQQEQYIANKIKKKIATSNELNYDVDAFIKNIEETEGIKITEEQRQMFDNFLKYNVSMLVGNAGCVDAETEVRTKDKWIKISDYNGEAILTTGMDGKALFEKPKYIKKEAKDMKRIKGIKYLDIVASEDHTMFLSARSKDLPKYIRYNKPENWSGSINRYMVRPIPLRDLERAYDEVDPSATSHLKNWGIARDFGVHNHSDEERGLIGVPRIEEHQTLFYKVFFGERIDRIIPQDLEAMKVYRGKEKSFKTSIQNGYGIKVTIYDYQKEILEGMWEAIERSPKKPYGYIRLGMRHIFFFVHQVSLSHLVNRLYPNQSYHFFRNMERCNLSVEDLVVDDKETADGIQMMYHSHYSRRKRKTISINKTREGYVFKVQDTYSSYVSQNRELRRDIVDYETSDGMMYCFETTLGGFVARRKDDIFITGNSGKSYIFSLLHRMIKDMNLTHMLLAPTGKASANLKAYTKSEVQTVHKGLKIGGAGGEYEHDVVVVDEVSMMDVPMMKTLLAQGYNPNTRYLFIGDDFQIPSVGVGRILYDMIESDVIPYTKLTKVFRQEGQGTLGIATKARNKEYFLEDNGKARMKFGEDAIVHLSKQDKMAELYEKYYVLAKKKYDPDEIVVLSPTKKGNLGTVEINKRIQEIVNPESDDKNQVVMGDTVFREGDLIINTVNNYEAADAITKEPTTIYNGDQGVIEQIFTKDRILHINYDGKKVILDGGDLNTILHRYCMTIHKMQGSSAKFVIMLMDKAHTWQMNSNLLYTGITRTVERFVLLTNPSVVKTTLQKNANSVRNTFMKDILLEDSYDENYAQMFDVSEDDKKEKENVMW